jgi:hypothetical protein
VGWLRLIAFQAGKALVMDLRDADKGADVLAILLLGFGDLGEPLSEFLVVVDVHGSYEFQGLIDGFQSLINGARFGVCVVCHGEAASPASIIA